MFNFKQKKESVQNDKVDAAFVTNKAVALIKLLHGTTLGAKEFSGGFTSERVDAILFNSRSSFMIETKISRSDFKADIKKSFRTNGHGVGKYRYFACPNGLILPEELPEKWGLIYVFEGKKRAEMPVGFGGSIRTGEKIQNPNGWQDDVWKHYGSPRLTGENNDSPNQPEKFFSFDDRDLRKENRFLYFLATRYKEQKFLENLL